LKVFCKSESGSAEGEKKCVPKQRILRLLSDPFDDLTSIVDENCDQKHSLIYENIIMKSDGFASNPTLADLMDLKLR
jgi:hypothetical protein